MQIFLIAAVSGWRKIRAHKMIEKLAAMGISIEWERVEDIAGAGSVGRPHIAQAMLEKGYGPSLKEAFNQYIGREAPAYVEREKMTPEEVVRLITRAGGLAVLAHPAEVEVLEHLIPRLQRVGLVGMEVYYNNYQSSIIQHLASLAHQHALVATGGSDFHGMDAATETPIGGVAIPRGCVERLLALNERRVH